jgi:pimeloyl-ACP methyl ester carboxylesterase
MNLMKHANIVMVLILCGTSVTRVSADDMPEKQFPGTRSEWNGFEQFDFTLEEVKCRVVSPKDAAKGRPWIWRARFWGHEPQTDIALLKKGFHVAYCDVANLWGNEEAIRRWDSFYKFLTTKHGFSHRPALEGMSRGGLIIYHWAIKHPTQVSCIYGDAPALGIRPYVRDLSEGDPVGSKYSADHEVQWRTSVRSPGANDSPSNRALVWCNQLKCRNPTRRKCESDFEFGGVF